jgi:hypothetical protein
MIFFVIDCENYFANLLCSSFKMLAAAGAAASRKRKQGCGDARRILHDFQEVAQVWRSISAMQ